MRSGCSHMDAFTCPSRPRLQPLSHQLPLYPAKADGRHRLLLQLGGFYRAGRRTLQPGQRMVPWPRCICSGHGGWVPGAPLLLLGMF